MGILISKGAAFHLCLFLAVTAGVDPSSSTSGQGVPGCPGGPKFSAKVLPRLC